jgi:SAM-dependent methyltransferase
MRYYDLSKKRLIYIGSEATQKYWDAHWQPARLTREKILANKRTYIVPITQKHLKSADGPILEGGCGWGQHVAALVHHNYTCIGVDYAPQTVKNLNQLVPELDIRLGDVHQLPFDDGFFAGYWSLGVIEHFWHGYDRIAQEMKRVLQPGGILFLTFPYLSPLRRFKIKRNLFDTWSGGEDQPTNFYQFAYDHRQVVKQYETLGFSLVEMVPLDGLKGLKDEVDFGKQRLQAWYDYRGRSFMLRGARLAFSRLAALWSAHSILLVLRKEH